MTEGRFIRNCISSSDPAYMSPEQAGMSGLDLTPAVTSTLGCCFMIAAGRTPFDAKELMASGLDGCADILRRNPLEPAWRRSYSWASR